MLLNLEEIWKSSARQRCCVLLDPLPRNVLICGLSCKNAWLSHGCPLPLPTDVGPPGRLLCVLPLPTNRRLARQRLHCQPPSACLPVRSVPGAGAPISVLQHTSAVVVVDEGGDGARSGWRCGLGSLAKISCALRLAASASTPCVGAPCLHAAARRSFVRHPLPFASCCRTSSNPRTTLRSKFTIGAGSVTFGRPSKRS